MTKLQKTQFINSFALKIIAIITMTFDHVGVFLTLYLPVDDPTVMAFRIIGRLSLPLFCLGIAEGVIHTKDFKKYALKLGIMATVMTVAFIVLNSLNIFTIQTIASMGNIFIDLLLGALIVYLLKQDKWYIKLLALLPAAFAIASYACTTYEGNTGAIVWWLPFCIRTQYGFYGVLLIVLFYFAYWASDVITQAYASNSGLDRDTVFPGGSQRLITNVLMIIVLGFATFMYWLTVNQFGGVYLDVQPYVLIVGVLLLFYNGERGYNGKGLQHGFYLYYPLHLLVLVLIYLLLNM